MWIRNDSCQNELIWNINAIANEQNVKKRRKCGHRRKLKTGYFQKVVNRGKIKYLTLGLQIQFLCIDDIDDETTNV